MADERIDKWLWATRIFKTRSLATDACKRGHVTIDGMNVKPSRPVKVGDIVSVKKTPVTYTFRVIGITQNRVGAKLVPNFLENLTPPEQYHILEMVRIGGFVRRQKGLGRPTKKEGREIKEFTDEAFFGFDDFNPDDIALWDDDDNDSNPLWTDEDEEKLSHK